jgi:copper chaperone CopZ
MKLQTLLLQAFVVLFGFMGCATTSSATCPTGEKAPVNASVQPATLKGGESANLEVLNMHCGRCTAKVRKALREDFKFDQVSVDLESKRAGLSCPAAQKSCDLGAAIQALNDLGYATKRL